MKRPTCPSTYYSTNNSRGIRCALPPLHLGDHTNLDRSYAWPNLGVIEVDDEWPEVEPGHCPFCAEPLDGEAATYSPHLWERPVSNLLHPTCLRTMRQGVLVEQEAKSWGVGSVS